MNRRPYDKLKIWLVLFFAASFAISAPSISLSQDVTLQDWRGLLKVKIAGIVVQKLDMQLLLADDPNSPDSQMISLSQNGVGMSFDELVREGDDVKFKINQLGVEFAGKINESKNEITGTFKQGGMKIPLTFKHEATAKHTSTKTGIMKTGVKSFDFQFRFFTDEKGNELALLDSFSENIGSLNCTVDRKDGQLIIGIQNTNAKFVGEAGTGEKAAVITGNWLQNKNTIPLVLTEVAINKTRPFARKAKPKRPQMPKAPFPYEVEDVEVSLKKVDPKSDRIKLAGTLTVPKGDGKHPAVILISGSGPQDRDETLFDHKPFWVIADHLTRNGFAVLRYDERGVGKSTGDFASANSADLAKDAETLFTWLSRHDKIDKDKITLMGHSEGGYIAPMIAARNSNVAGVVMLAGPGVTGREISKNQTLKISKAGGASDGMIEFNNALNTGVYDRLKSELPLNKEFKTKFKSEMEALWKEKIEGEMPPGLIEASIASINAPWTKFFLFYDPAVDLAKTKCPVLALIGENDIQVDADLNMPAIRAALEKAGNSDVELKRLPKLNHLFQVSETGVISEYQEIEQTIDPAVLELITDWLSKRFK